MKKKNTKLGITIQQANLATKGLADIFKKTACSLKEFNKACRRVALLHRLYGKLPTDTGLINRLLNAKDYIPVRAKTPDYIIEFIKLHLPQEYAKIELDEKVFISCEGIIRDLNNMK